MGHRIGYARVSTEDQNLEGQLQILNEQGCTRVYTDKASGKDTNRPEWAKLYDRLDAGDVLIVTKLDRIGRSVRDLIGIIEDLNSRGVGLIILDLNIDTTTPAGKLVATFVAGVAEFERNLNRQRTIDGLAAARAAGRVGGRPVTVTDEQIAEVEQLSHTIGVAKACRKLGVNRSSYYRVKKSKQ